MKIHKHISNIKLARVERHVVCGGDTFHKDAARAFNKARRQNAKLEIAQALNDDTNISVGAAEWDETLDWDVYCGNASYEDSSKYNPHSSRNCKEAAWSEYEWMQRKGVA